jgi:hypothetical protein
MEEESKMFRRFLRTLNNNNWSEFANKILENDN